MGEGSREGLKARLRGVILFKAMIQSCVTGAGGQIGSYLVEYLLSRGDLVHGIVRRSSTFDISRTHLKNASKNPRFILHVGDITSEVFVRNFFKNNSVDQFYNAAAQSHVGDSWKYPEHTIQVNGNAVISILEQIRHLSPKTKFLQFSTSELFGKVRETPQRETTPFYPRSPYGISKLMAYWGVVNYRESYGLHLSNVILFNSESPRRASNFVTKKISQGISDISRHLSDMSAFQPLRLGTLNSQRDWNDARRMVMFIPRILSLPEPTDMVLGSGVTRSIQEYLERTLETAGIEYELKDLNRSLYVLKGTNTPLTIQDPEFVRPAEVDLLLADSSKAQKEIQFLPDSSEDFSLLVKDIYESCQRG